MSNVAHGAATDFDGMRMGVPDQKSRLSGLDAQELLQTRLLVVGGREQPVKNASIFDRDDNMRVATNAKSFELSSEEIVDIQDRIMAASGAVGAQKTPVKVQGKEYKLVTVTVDNLLAKADDGEHVYAALTASMLLVFTSDSDQVDALSTLAQSFAHGLAQQAV